MVDQKTPEAGVGVWIVKRNPNDPRIAVVRFIDDLAASEVGRTGGDADFGTCRSIARQPLFEHFGFLQEAVERIDHAVDESTPSVQKTAA